MEKIDIIKVNPNDIEKLKKIGKKTFFETFSEDNKEEDMNKYLNEEFSDEKLKEELSNKNSEFYFATMRQNIMGYLKINFGEAQTELKDPYAVEIERIYVLKEYQGKKVGQQLYQKAIDVAKKLNADYLWLGVWEKNLKAISFYKKNGFLEFDKHIFKLGSDHQTDIMMKLPMSNLRENTF